ncbi:MAG: AAA-like domain-containing protein [Rhizonema sp. PD38]|nr:AAA-like domain-containing protein [Rhizonema sp. PD38]
MFSDLLRRHRVNLQEDDKLDAALKQVVASPQPVRIETGLAFKLRSMGLVKFQGNDVMPLCGLYSLYFGDTDVRRCLWHRLG